MDLGHYINLTTNGIIGEVFEQMLLIEEDTYKQ